MDSSSSSSSSLSLGHPAPPPPAPAAPAAAVASKRTKRGHVCKPCKDLRKKCDGQVPCFRCFKKGITCVLPTQGQNQQASFARRANHPAASVAAAAAAAGIPAMEAFAAAASSASLQQTVVVELAFQRASPRPLVELLGQCFMRQATAPGARREMVVDCMRQWYLRGIAAGGDVTWGILSRCMQALNVNAAELEDPRWAASDAAPEQRRLELFQQLGTAVANGPALLTEAFGPIGFADPFSQINCSVHIPPFDGHGPHAVAANASHLRKLNATFLEKRTLHFALSALLVAPEDRETFFESFFKVYFCATPTRIVQIGKGFDRDGRVALYVGEMRPARILPDGTPWGIATKYEPAPMSRHLTVNPGKRASHVEAFRELGGGRLSPGASAALAAAAVPPGGMEPAAAPLRTAAPWLRELQLQQRQQGQSFAAPGLAAAAAAAAAAGSAPPIASGGLEAVPFAAPAPGAHTYAHAPPSLSPRSLLPIAGAGAGGHMLVEVPPSYSPSLLAAGAGGHRHPLDGPPDLDKDFLEGVFSDDEERDG